MRVQPTGIRAITFEITSTLVSMSVPLGQVYGDAVRYYQLPCPPDDTIKAAFKMAYKMMGTELPNFGAAQGMSERAWWARMIKQTLIEANCVEALEDETFPLVFQRIYSAFGSPDVWAPCPEGARAMRHAKESGLVVGVVSNVYHRYVDQNLPLLGLHKDLDFAAISYELDDAKPSPHIFREAIRKASHVHRLLYGKEQPDILPSEVLHVGDDLQKDYMAAKKAGMCALLFDPKHDGECSSEVVPSDVITSLDEVPAKIDEILAERSRTGVTARP